MTVQTATSTAMIWLTQFFMRNFMIPYWDLRIHVLKWWYTRKYGDKKNFPSEVMSKIYKLDDFAKNFDMGNYHLSVALYQLLDFFKLKQEDSLLAVGLAAARQGVPGFEAQIAKVLRIQELQDREQIRRAVYASLCEQGLINPRMLPLTKTPEELDKLERFLTTEELLVELKK